MPYRSVDTKEHWTKFLVKSVLWLCIPRLWLARLLSCLSVTETEGEKSRFEVRAQVLQPDKFNLKAFRPCVLSTATLIHTPLASPISALNLRERREPAK